MATSAPHATTAVQFEAGELVASGTLDATVGVQQMSLGPDVAAVLGVPVVTDAPAESKTMKFQGHLFAAGGVPAGTLDDVTVTGTRMTNPSTGAPWIFITFSYLATAAGFRTGLGGPGEPYGNPQGLYFKNSDGGTIFSWGFSYQDFILRCEWNREFQYYVIRDTEYVSWFDVWTGVEHRVVGPLFRC